MIIPRVFLVQGNTTREAGARKHVASQYSLEQSSSFPVSYIVPPDLDSKDVASALVGLAGAMSLAPSLPPSVLRRTRPTQQVPTGDLPVWEAPGNSVPIVYGHVHANCR